MFGKQANPDGSDAVTRSDHNGGRKSLKVASLVCDSLSITGDLSGETQLHVDGAIIGDVEVTRLLIGEQGTIEGAVSADTVDIRGKVVGSVKAKRVHLFATAIVSGDITHEQLTVNAGAEFQGRGLKFHSAAVHVLADAVAGEAKSS